MKYRLAVLLLFILASLTLMEKQNRVTERKLLTFFILPGTILCLLTVILATPRLAAVHQDARCASMSATRQRPSRLSGTTISYGTWT